MPIQVKTSAINGVINEDSLTVQDLYEEIDTGAFAVDIGPEISVKTQHLVSFYSGEPPTSTSNTYAVYTENNGMFIITLPEGEDGRSLTKKVNEVAAGEKDRFGNIHVRNPFVVLGDEYAVGIRFEEYQYAAKAIAKNSEEPTEETTE